MKTIVTGGCGFIGSHLVELLIQKGHSVTVIDNFSTGRKENLDHLKGDFKIIEADISSSGEWQRSFKDVDSVFHLAALADIVPYIQNPDLYFRSNVDGTFNVLQAARSANVKRFVYSASSSCYGIPDVYPTPEEADIRPQYPYALTKRMGEELVLHWAQVYKLPAVSLRFFNVYGTRSRTSGTYGAVFGVFLAQKLAGTAYTIVGDGEQTRDFTYVGDVVRANLLAADSAADGVYNVGSGQSYSINQIADFIGGEKEYLPARVGDPRHTLADNSSAAFMLKWKPTINLETWIKKQYKE